MSYPFKVYNVIQIENIKKAIGVFSNVIPSENEYYSLPQLSIGDVEISKDNYNKIEAIIEMKEDRINQIFLTDKYFRPIIGIDLLEGYSNSFCEKIKLNCYITLENVTTIEVIKLDMKDHYEKQEFPHRTLVQSDFGVYKLYGLESIKINESQYYKLGSIDLNTLAKKLIDEKLHYYEDSKTKLEDGLTYNLIWNQIAEKGKPLYIHQCSDLGYALDDKKKLGIHSVFGIFTYDNKKIYGNKTYTDIEQNIVNETEELYYPSVFLDFNKKSLVFSDDRLHYDGEFTESYINNFIDFNGRTIPKSVNRGFSIGSHNFKLAPRYSEYVEQWNIVYEIMLTTIKQNWMYDKEKLILGKYAIIIQGENYIRWIPLSLNNIHGIKLYSASLFNVIEYTDTYRGIFLRYKDKNPIVFRYNGEVEQVNPDISLIYNLQVRRSTGEVIYHDMETEVLTYG